MPTIMLVDNGSKRADSTLGLRRLAAGLGERVGHRVHAVSLQHADQVPAEELHGTAADTFEPFMRDRLGNGQRAFTLVPLFFGPSGAITRFVPERYEALTRDFGPFDLRIADVLCPLPAGESRLVDILAENVVAARNASMTGENGPVVVVDHGSPSPPVTAVRHWLARELRARLPWTGVILEAAMERRRGAEYDFNGALLADLLRQLASEKPNQTVILGMLFLSPGRHAGLGGDVDAISHDIMRDFPTLRVESSRLVGDHDLIIDILADRLQQAVDQANQVGGAASSEVTRQINPAWRADSCS